MALPLPPGGDLLTTSGNGVTSPQLYDLVKVITNASCPHQLHPYPGFPPQELLAQGLSPESLCLPPSSHRNLNQPLPYPVSASAYLHTGSGRVPRLSRLQNHCRHAAEGASRGGGCSFRQAAAARGPGAAQRDTGRLCAAGKTAGSRRGEGLLGGCLCPGLLVLYVCRSHKYACI